MQGKDSTVPNSIFMRVQKDTWGWISTQANSHLMKYAFQEAEDPTLKRFSPSDHLHLAFFSQFRHFIHIGRPTEQGTEYYGIAASTDLEAVEKCPVLLASRLERPEDETSFTSNRIYPPKEHGIIGIVSSREAIYVYNILELSQKAQGRQKRIGQKLAELEAQYHTDALSIPLFDKDVEVKTMIQQLAQDYYQHHLQQGKLPIALDIFDNGEALAASCQAMQLVTFASQNAVARGADQWKYTSGHPPYFLRGRNTLEFKDGESSMITDDTSNALWDKVKNHQTDTQIDLAFAVISLCIRSTEPDHSAWIYTENFLKGRGLEKITKPIEEDNPYGIRRTAGYRPENYQNVGQALFNLEKMWLTIAQQIDTEQHDSKTKKRKKREFTYKGRFLIVKGSLTQKDLGTTSNDTGIEIAWHIAPGDWLAPFLESPNRQVANLSEKALQYDPYRQKWEKYLSRYFFFNGHMNSKGRGCTFNRQIARLLEDCSLNAGERDRQKRTRDHFEKAMNQLVTDDFINNWYYTEHKQGYIPSKKTWLYEWLDQMITVEIAPRQGKHELA